MDAIVELCNEKRIAHFDIKVTDNILATLWYGCYLDLTPTRHSSSSTSYHDCFSIEEVDQLVNDHQVQFSQLQHLKIAVRIRKEHLCNVENISERWKQLDETIYLNNL